VSELHNPYVGLRPFDLQDSLQFFGREAQTAELLAVLRQYRFLGVVGSSGSGKSSLVRAGLLPALFGGFLVGDRDRWRIVQIKPGDSPMRNLAAGLLAAWSETAPTEADIAALEAAIRDEQADAVITFVKERLTDRESLFLLVDQFEEIFAFRAAGDDQRAEAADCVALLMALADEHVDVPVFVTLTMRTDFLGDCDLFYGLPEIMNRGQYLVPRLTRQQLRLAIEGPAMLTGARFAPQLMDLLLNQLGDREDRLPVIQHALLRTWDAWHSSGAAGPIEVRHFDEAGGLENALDRDAEAALTEVKAALPALDDRVVASVFKALTDTDLSHRAVRRPARVHALMAASGANRATVDTIIRCFRHRNRNFLYADGWPAAPDPRVDISHESLIRQWTRLREWVADERDRREQFTSLVLRARSWQKYGVLLLGNELKSAEAWWKSAGPSAAWARRYAVAGDDFAVTQRFLETSTTARRRTTLIRFASAAVLAIVVAGTLWFVQLGKARSLQTELLRGMESHASLLLERDPESAIVAGLIAAESHALLFPGVPLPAALESILLRAWQDSALEKTLLLKFDGDAEHARLSAEAGVVLLGGPAVVDGGSGVKIFSLTTGDLLDAVPTQSRAQCEAFSSQGTRLNFTHEALSGQRHVDTREDGKTDQFEKDYRRVWWDCTYSADASHLALISSKQDRTDWMLTVAAVSDDGVVKIRDVPLLATFAEHRVPIRFSNNGRQVAVALTSDWSGTRLIIVDGNVGWAPTVRFTTPNDVEHLALSEEGLLATVERAYTSAVFLRNLRAGGAGAVILPNSGSADDYGGLSFSPDGRLIAGINGDTATLWDLSQLESNLSAGVDVAVFKGHPRGILAVGFDAENRLVTVGQDADVRYWRADTRERFAVQSGGRLRRAVMSHDARFVYTAGLEGSLQRWSGGQSEPHRFGVSGALHLALSPDGRILAVVDTAQNTGSGQGVFTISILNAESGDLLASLDGGSDQAGLAFSPDGGRLVSSHSTGARVWTLPPLGTKPYRPSDPVIVGGGHSPPVTIEDVAFSLDQRGRQVATVTGRAVYLWNAATGACEGRIDTLSKVFSVSYVPGGAQIATGDVLGRIKFWSLAPVQAAGCAASTTDDARPKEPIRPDRTLQEHRGPIRAISFVGDGSRFATASDDRTANVWDTGSGRVLLTLRQGRAVTQAQFTRGGGALLTTVEGQGAKLWEIPLREQLLAFARARVTRTCLTTEERQRFFPGKPIDDPRCIPVPD
jgi:WD40 repeat protein